MKCLLKSGFLLLVFGFCILGWTANESSESYLTVRKDLRLNVDGVMQFHSIMDFGSPLIGAAMSYNLSGSESLGLRAMLSVDSGGAYAFQVFERHYFSQNKTALYLEPTFAFNILTRGLQNILSGGLSLGVCHFFTRDISVGGSAGVEVFKGSLPLAAYAHLGEWGIAPKLLLEGTFHL